jgi:dUTP pyrophosphatase
MYPMCLCVTKKTSMRPCYYLFVTNTEGVKFRLHFSKCSVKFIIHNLSFIIKNIMVVKIINKSQNALPAYETEGSAGMDLRANITESITLKPLERFMIPTGLFIELPLGYEAQVRPRSGLAAKRGLTCLNSPGTIDADYRGELKVILVNLSNEEQTIEVGERVAQMIIAKHERVTLHEVEVLTDTVRGAGGFGSTGTK